MILYHTLGIHSTRLFSLILVSRYEVMKKIVVIYEMPDDAVTNEMIHQYVFGDRQIANMSKYVVGLKIEREVRPSSHSRTETDSS